MDDQEIVVVSTEEQIVTDQSKLPNHRYCRRNIRNPPKSRFGKFLYWWREFFHTANFAGLRYVGGYGKYGCCGRLCWTLLYLGVFLAGGWFASGAIKSYKRNNEFSIKTKFGQKVDVAFPLVSFCTKAFFPVSSICSPQFMLMNFMNGDGHIRKHRDDKLGVMQSVLSMQLLHNCSIEAIYDGHDYTVQENIDNVILADVNFARSCLWMNKQVPCRTLFTYHFAFGNRKLCFTFTSNMTGHNLWLASPGYGLSVLLDTDESNYIAFDEAKNNRGFEMFVHDKNRYSMLDDITPFKLSPSFDYSVAMKATTIHRKLSSIGMCSDNFNERCLINVYSKYVSDRCRCLPDLGDFQVNDKQQLARYDHQNSVPCLSMNEILCVQDAYEMFVKQPGYFKYQCGFHPCSESVFDLTVSHSRLLADKRYSSSKTALKVNIYADTLLISNHEYSLVMVSLRDVFLYNGRKCRILASTSFVSFAEIGLFILIAFGSCFTHCCCNGGKKRISDARVKGDEIRNLPKTTSGADTSREISVNNNTGENVDANHSNESPFVPDLRERQIDFNYLTTKVTYK